jgi:thiol-disulfide isomerase/thioredoxin
MPKLMLPFALTISLVLAGGGYARGDAADAQKQITELLEAKKTVEAEEAFQAAIKESPDAKVLKDLRLQFYLAYARSGNAEASSTHAVAYFEDQLAAFDGSPPSTRQLVTSVNIVTNALSRIGKSQEAIERLDAALNAIGARIASEHAAELKGSRSDLRRSKVLFLARSGKAADGLPLLKEELSAAAADFEAHSDNASSLTRFAQWRETQIALISEITPDEARPLWENHLAFLVGQMQKNPADERVVAVCINGSAQGIRALMADAPDAAEQSLKDLQQAIEALDAKPIAMKNLIDRAGQMITQLERTLAAERQRLALIGKPAIPLDVEVWVNGEPLSAADLAGKVVLLDFWAVWCGPCIATFPHLREWNEKYGSQGLVVIGATRYYQYDWDDEGKQIKADKQLTPEQEQAALVRFAAHHELKHRFAVVPKDSEFQASYGVTGIPQVVLIDRAGNVRMIRVGSGDKNAHDLDEMLKKLLAEPGETAVK